MEFLHHTANKLYMACKETMEHIDAAYVDSSEGLPMLGVVNEMEMLEATIAMFKHVRQDGLLFHVSNPETVWEENYPARRVADLVKMTHRIKAACSFSKAMLRILELFEEALASIPVPDSDEVREEDLMEYADRVVQVVELHIGSIQRTATEMKAPENRHLGTRILEEIHFYQYVLGIRVLSNGHWAMEVPLGDSPLDYYWANDADWKTAYVGEEDTTCEPN